MQAESSAAGRKRAGRVVLSDSEEEGGSARSSPVKPDGSARKRAKPARKPVNPPSEDEDEDENEDDRRVNGHHEEEETSEEEAAVPRRDVGNKPAYQRDTDNFVSGSIVRIKLINFITYDHVEFRPGPYLNMIMGPNGTGKSTIAAGIAIGLGFAPKVMGRVNDLKSYVKIGTDEARTEIELKGRPGKPNPIIWRSFTNMNDTSEWRLNGQATTRRAVQELVSSFDVQSNNLCSFLPQDKVAEFAKMAPDLVLRETMRAAGDPRLTKWHDDLKEKGEKRDKLATTLEAAQAEKQKVARDLERLRPDVDRLEDRERLEFQKSVLEVEWVMADFNQTKAEHSAGLHTRKALREKLKAAKEKRAPLQELATKWKDKATKATAASARVADDLKTYTNEAKDLHRSLENSTKSMAELDRKISNLDKQVEQREKDRKILLSRIAECKRRMDEPLEEGHEERGHQLREARPKLAAESTKASEVYEKARDKVDAFHRETGHLNNAIEQYARKHQQESSVESRRELDARSFNPSLSFMLDWLKKYGAELESEVGLPPMMSVNVPDKRYAWQVEMCTNLAQRSTFICTSRKDYDRLLQFQGKIVHNVEVPNVRENGTRRIPDLKLQLNLAYVEMIEENLNPPKPHSGATLRDYGLECYAIDKVEAPAPVIAFLNKRAGLFKIPLTQRISSEVDIDKINQDLRLTTVVTGDAHFNSTRSAYGRQDFQSTTRPKENPKAFATTVNTAALARIEDELKKLRLEKQEREAPANKAKNDLQVAKERWEKTTKDLDDNLEAAKRWQEKTRQHMTAKASLTSHEGRLRALDEMPSVDADRDKYKKEKLKLLNNEMENLRDLWDHGTGAIVLADASVSNVINIAVAEQNQHIIEDHQTERDEAFVELERSIETLTKRLEALVARSQELLREIKSRARDDEDFMKEVQKRQKTTRTPDEVEGEITEIVNQLDMAANIDPGVLERYRNFEEALGVISEKVEQDSADLGVIQSQIDRILSKFDPALDRLVAVVSDKFSKAFASLNCSGEVRMARSESYAKWGIEIMVSYRDDQSLELLTGSRQSGGERSLATITYLMSLSEMARAPFSLVDEINQGMDSRAERAVFNQLVQTTCQNTAGQYFLITPKLLVGLKYHEMMKVLFVENGGGLLAPAGASKSSGRKRLRWGDFSGCLQAAKNARGNGTAGASASVAAS